MEWEWPIEDQHTWQQENWPERDGNEGPTEEDAVIHRQQRALHNTVMWGGVAAVVVILLLISGYISAFVRVWKDAFKGTRAEVSRYYVL